MKAAQQQAHKNSCLACPCLPLPGPACPCLSVPGPAWACSLPAPGLQGINLRGDINVAIVGDPACAKSQMLK